MPIYMPETGSWYFYALYIVCSKDILGMNIVRCTLMCQIKVHKHKSNTEIHEKLRPSTRLCFSQIYHIYLTTTYIEGVKQPLKYSLCGSVLFYFTNCCLATLLLSNQCK